MGRSYFSEDDLAKNGPESAREQRLADQKRMDIDMTRQIMERARSRPQQPLLTPDHPQEEDFGRSYSPYP